MLLQSIFSFFKEICNNEFGHLLTLNKNFYHKAGIENVQDVVQKEIDDIFHNSGE